MGRGPGGIALALAGLLGTTCMWPKTFTIVERVHLADRRAETQALEGNTCVPGRVSPDRSTSAPHPVLEEADLDFAGDIHGLREYLYVHEDGSYDYVETWSVGLPPFWELVTLGTDWKVGCRIHSCTLPAGTPCCWQACREGGDWGWAFEGPDRFGCMNRATGAIYQWFLEALADAGVAGLEECL